MTSKTGPGTARARTSAIAAPAPRSDAGRQQMAVAAESAGVMARGFEAMRQINDRAVQGTLARYAAAAQKLGTRRPPMELLAVPAELMRSEFEGATSYWQALSGAALEMQAELIGCSSHLVDSDAVLQAAAAMESLPVFGGSGFFAPKQESRGRG